MNKLKYQKKPAGTGTVKSVGEIDRRRRSSAGALSVDDISSDVINQQELQLRIQQMRSGASFGMSCDDISLDVITISRRSSLLSRRKMKRRRKGDPVASYSAFSRCYLKMAKRCRLHKRSYSGSNRNAKISSRNVLSIQSQEDSGEAFGQPDASNSSIQSRAHMNQLLLYIFSRKLCIQSTWIPRRKESKISAEDDPVAVLNQ
ncbi:hypothetical protein F511_43114 [Dorcoceras hygrometricum]|uniref:Uncharacterized protein n=1 Tax=Dorcoceras hygrometricum TaxID=472368 RepID=A0A2Z7B912_9LAMI|nr:hypothetical protein F511_43114 [Dorcoceras hygrometricum]